MLELKYRPTKLGDMVGNSKIKEGVGLLSAKGEGVTIMLTGESGTGKTTTARIIGAEFGVGETLEYNCSDDNGVEFARMIVNTASTRGFYGRRLFILDEVHRLTADAQNIMLKVTEEPGDNVFVLITTNPEKLLPTFKKRCRIFETEKPSRKEAIDYLQGVVDAEGFNVADSLLRTIVKNTDGCMRDSMIQLSMVAQLPVDQQESAVAKQKSVDATVGDLCRAMLQVLPWSRYTEILATLKGDESERRAILGYMTAVLMKSDNRKAAIAIDNFSSPWYDTGKSGLVLATYKTHIG